MVNLKTIYSSNTPIDCYILKGRLECEGINCFIFDEHIVWVHPFWAVTIGGVKLKVPSDKFDLSQKILEKTKEGYLIDNNGEYKIKEIFNSEFEKQQEVIRIKSEIRKNPDLLEKPKGFQAAILSQSDIETIIDSEKEFKSLTDKKLKFTWKDFFYELFDFDRDVFKYLRIRPVEYYLDKDIVDKYNSINESDSADVCPNCKSKNTHFGYAIDNKWHILYLILSLLFFTPLPLIRKKNHCFDCGCNF